MLEAITTERVELRARDVTVVGDWYRCEKPRGSAVLLHGGGQTRHSWSGTAEALASAGWATLSLDARGHGESDWARDGDYEIDAFVDDLAEVLRTLPEKPVVIGASLGGITTLLAEGERGGLARAIVLVDIAPRVEPEGVARIRAFMRAHLDGFASLEEVAAAVQAYNPHRKPSGNLEGLKKNVRLHADGRWYWHWDPRLVTRARMSNEAARAESHQRMLRAARAVRVPTLLVRGGRSDVVSQQGVDELLAHLPDGRYVDVAAAGHMVAGDENDAFTQAILAHLESP